MYFCTSLVCLVQNDVNCQLPAVQFSQRIITKVFFSLFIFFSFFFVLYFYFPFSFLAPCARLLGKELQITTKLFSRPLPCLRGCWGGWRCAHLLLQQDPVFRVIKQRRSKEGLNNLLPCLPFTRGCWCKPCKVVVQRVVVPGQQSIQGLMLFHSPAGRSPSPSSPEKGQGGKKYVSVSGSVK